MRFLPTIRLRHGLIPAIAILAVGCQPQPATVAAGAACAVPRIATAYERTPAAQRPADVPPRASVLPTPELTDAEADAAGACARPTLLAAAARSGDTRLLGSANWKRFSTVFYRSEHGRYLEVTGNARADAYLQFEDGPPLPIGAVVLKRAFIARQSGDIVPAAQFVIEKMQPGYDPRVGDWKFTLINEAGVIVGESRGRDGEKVEYCVECHKSSWRQNFLFFIPPEYRPKS
ncbi:MAG: hypothetical protein FJX54_02780 [Alphaproteobacteria bacterium]|nr:hypothetical protein [Alphaproteobacteria bacterium]